MSEKKSRIKAWLMWCPLPTSGPLWELLVLLTVGGSVLACALAMGK